MKTKLMIEVAGVIALIFVFAGTVHGVAMGPSALEEKERTAQSYMEVKCDPCDYNIDYGDREHPAKKGGVDEGVVLLECDPCDYNVDYGASEKPTGK